MKHILVVLALSVFIVGCDNEPSKPSNVPANAFFVGGKDGGVFLRCVRNFDNTKIYRCTIYNDFNGEVWSEGIFAIENENSEFNPDDKEMYSAWDGARIILKDYRSLVKVKTNEQTAQ